MLEAADLKRCCTYSVTITAAFYHNVWNIIH